MAVKQTSNGKKGGTLKGKRHYDKDGKHLGGIKAIVTDTKQIVELEGGEVIINREASKKHWKELSKINQSAGNGVPILPPDEVMADADEYKKGGRTIQFNPNNVPSKLIYNYAKKIKDQHPDVWALGSNAYNNEAFENLERVIKRGYWLPKENWFYVKWQTFGLRHKEDDKIERIIADLKWLNKVENGFGYMKDVIDKHIGDNNITEMKKGGLIKIDGEKYKIVGLGDSAGKYQDIVLQLEYDDGLGHYFAIKNGDNWDLWEMDEYIHDPLNTLKKGGKVPVKSYPKKELAMGINEEHEHDKTFRKLYSHEITPKEAPKHVAVEHLEKDEHYYTKLAEVEGFKDGGKIATVMHEFKEGRLRSSSGQLVTDRKQALAIAISEQRRAEQKMELGGRVTCAKCGHKWLKANEDTHTCKVCNHDNEKRLDLIDNKHYVNIEKVEDMNKTEIFFNPDIFKSGGDYILGGFNAEELNGIIVAGDDFALSFPKLENIFEKRIERAIENFKNEIRANIIKSGRNVEDVDFEQEFYDEFNNLTETYLGETITSTSTEKIKDFIVNHSAYQTWSARIEKRVTAFRDKITQDASKVNDPKTSKVSVSDAVNLTYCSTLEEILEQLFNIVEDNTL